MFLTFGVRIPGSVSPASKKPDQIWTYLGRDKNLPPATTHLFRVLPTGVMMNYPPKQGTIKGKSLKPTIHLHCLIPLKWVPFNDPCPNWEFKVFPNIA